MNRILKITLLIILGFLLFYFDFVRDYIFKNIDLQIHYLSFLSPEGLPTTENYTDSWMEAKLQNLSISSLVNLKWYFTAVFTFIFFVFGSIIPYIIYENKATIKFAVILYGLLLTGALLIYSLRFLNSDYNWQENTYLIALGIMHFLQSSLPSILLLLSFKIHLNYLTLKTK